MILNCFLPLVGNDEVKRRLTTMLNKGAMGQALLFAGPEGTGKGLFAWALATTLISGYDENKANGHRIRLGQHPDVHIYHPEGKLGLHSIESMRQLIETVYLPPYEARFKVFIIHEAERMLSYSAHALLKTLEEPPSDTLFILLSDSPTAILPTVLSRCYTLYFRPINSLLIREFLLKRYPSLQDEELNRIVSQSEGSIGRAVRLVRQGEAMRHDLLQALREGSIKNYRVFQEHIHSLGDRIDQIKKQAEESVRDEFAQAYKDHHLSVQQQRDMEKEAEGLVALVLLSEAKRLFEGVLSWYRDMQVLLLGGRREHLIHADCQTDLEQAVQRGEYQELSQVWQYVEEALVALQQSTSLSVCLENLFLKLDQQNMRIS